MGKAGMKEKAHSPSVNHTLCPMLSTSQAEPPSTRPIPDLTTRAFQQVPMSLHLRPPLGRMPGRQPSANDREGPGKDLEDTPRGSLAHWWDSWEECSTKSPSIPRWE